MAQRLRSSGRYIFRALNLKRLSGGASSSEGRDGRPFFRALAPSSLKRKASNSFSAIQDTYFSTKEVFESHRVVFTVGTSIASILTAWAGYSLRQYHQSNVERRLESIEKTMMAAMSTILTMFLKVRSIMLNEQMMKTYDVEREEIKKIVTSGNISTTACVASVGTSLIIGYVLGWRSGLWFAKRKLRREQLKLMAAQARPRGWHNFRPHFLRFRKNQPLDLPPPASIPN